MIDLAGNNFDILGCHNYEYEPENYATGVRRIEDYLEKVCDYIRTSTHPNIKTRRPRMGPLPHLRLACRPARRRQSPDATKNSAPP